MKRWLKRILAAPFVLIAVLFVLLEDWLWDDLQRLAAAIGRLPIFRQLETFLINLPPYAALMTFAIPSVLLIPVKLGAFWLIAHGQATLGLLVIVTAKIAGTALVARIYVLTHVKLLSLGWFAWLHERFVAFKTRVYATIKATKGYHLAHQLAERIRARFRQRRTIWRARWNAARKFSKSKVKSRT